MEATSGRLRPLIGLCTLSLVLSVGLNRGEDFPVVLGGAVGLLMLGGIPALIHLGAVRVKSSGQRGGGPWYTWGTSMAVVFGLAFLGGTAEPSGTSQRDVRFAPEGFSFSVLFSADPEVTTFPMAQADGSWTDGLRAEVVHDLGVFERAEFMPLDPVVVAQLTRESILTDVEAYARAQGLSNLEFSYEHVNYGHVGGVRGYRTLFHEGRALGDAVYEMQAHFGPADVLMLYTGGPVDVYPTTETMAFRSSVLYEDDN